MDQWQATMLEAKKGNRANIRSLLRPDLFCFQIPDARPVVLASNPAQAYPLNGAPAVTLLKYTVPSGFLWVLNKLAILHIGGGIVDYSGNVVWRVLINDAGVKGMENLITQMGSNQAPIDIQPLCLFENDVIVITAEVPAGQANMPAGATSAARMHGFQMPIQKALNRPQQ